MRYLIPLFEAINYSSFFAFLIFLAMYCIFNSCLNTIIETFGYKLSKFNVFDIIVILVFFFCYLFFLYKMGETKINKEIEMIKQENKRIETILKKYNEEVEKNIENRLNEIIK